MEENVEVERRELSCPNCAHIVARWEKEDGYLFLGYKHYGLHKCRHCNHALSPKYYRMWKKEIKNG